MGLLIYLLYLTKLKNINVIINTCQLKHFFFQKEEKKIKCTNLSSYKTQTLIHKYIPL